MRESGKQMLQFVRDHGTGGQEGMSGPLEQDLKERCARLARALGEAGTDVALLQQSIDKYYFAGTVQQGFLAVGAEREPILFCRKGVERTQRETPWQVVALERPKDLPALLAAAGFSTGCVGVEGDVLPWQLYRQLERMFPDSRIEDVSSTVRALRQVKSEFELGEIRAAGAAWAEMMQETGRLLRPGANDHEISIRVDAHGRLQGGQGLMRTRGFNFDYFAPHVLFGPPGAVPAYFDGPTGGEGPHPSIGQGSRGIAIEPDGPILCDYAVAVRGYVADGTRTFVIGELPGQLQYAAELAIDILAEAEEAMHPGTEIASLFQRASRRAEERGLGQHFLGFGPDRARFLGHGIGLELDEFPVLTERAQGVLEPGMVIAVEPKFVFPGIGAVGVEDSFIVCSSGPAEVLTHFPRGPITLPRDGVR